MQTRDGKQVALREREREGVWQLCLQGGGREIFERRRRAPPGAAGGGGRGHHRRPPAFSDADMEAYKYSFSRKGQDTREPDGTPKLASVTHL